MSGLNKHILLLMKWLNDEDSVSREELLENRKAAADDAYAEIWVNKYFEISGENKQIYIDAIEAEKASSKKEQTKNYVKEYKGHKVPEGATHCDDAHSIFYKETDEAVFSCEFGELIWVDTGFLDIYLKELPEEPTHSWAGKGWPPAGTVCEVNIGQGDFVMCEVVCEYEGDHIFYDLTNGVRQLDRVSAKNGRNPYRPLKTQEQKDREAFIDRVMTGISIDVKHATIAHNIAEQLFDAGYKAPEGE